MMTSEQINELAAALAKAQGAMKPAIKDSENPHFRSKYADLAANVEAARAPLAANGLSVVQEATLAERGVAVTTRLLHASGQWIQFDPLTVPLSKADAHGVGSATSYARRYALGAALGLVADDDDGNAAVQTSKPRVSKPQPPPPGVTDGPAFEEPSHPPAQRLREAGQGHELRISEAQQKRLYALLKQAGYSVEDMQKWLKEVWGYDKSDQIPRVRYTEICSSIENRRSA
jgi:hypothetical protein